jgi:SAM-dependent methyltransferase
MPSGQPAEERVTMANEPKPRTAASNGRLWGARARDWAELLEPSVAPMCEEVLNRTGLGAGTHYLDIGCGAGMAAERAAARGAHVTGLDASEGFLALARERVPRGDFRVGDMEELPFAADQFDVVTGFNSIQFAGNPAIALAEARRVVKPTGIVAVVTWADPAGMEAVAFMTALAKLMPPPPGAPGPFALSDAALLRSVATAAGLKPGDMFEVACAFVFRDEASALRGLGSSGGAVRAIELAGEDAVRAAHAAAIAPFRQGDGSFRIGARFRCLLARP